MNDLMLTVLFLYIQKSSYIRYTGLRFFRLLPERAPMSVVLSSNLLGLFLGVFTLGHLPNVPGIYPMPGMSGVEPKQNPNSGCPGHPWY